MARMLAFAVFWIAGWFPCSLPSPDGPVAQLDRASDFYSEGCRFESCRDRQFIFLADVFGHDLWRIAQSLLANSPFAVFIFEGRSITTPICQSVLN